MSYKLKIGNVINGVNQIQLSQELFNEYKNKSISIYYNNIQISGQLKNEQYLIFNGSNSYVNCGNVLLDSKGKISSYFKTTYSGRQAIAGNINYRDLRYVLNYKPGSAGNSPGYLGFHTLYGGLKAFVDIGSIIYNGQWHLWEVEWDTNNVDMWFDGEKLNVTCNNSNTSSKQITLFLGNEISNKYFNGSLREFKLYDSNELIHYYSMDENGSSILYDRVGNNNGTIYNSQWGQTDNKINALIFDAPINNNIDYITIREGDSLLLNNYSDINIANLLEWDNLVKINSINYNIINGDDN